MAEPDPARAGQGARHAGEQDRHAHLLLGGGFGRRLNGDYAVPAALASKALGKPVKMVLTRADDMRFDSFRSPSVQTLRMAFDADGKVTAMEHQRRRAGRRVSWRPPHAQGAERHVLRPFLDRRRRPLVRRGRATRAGDLERPRQQRLPARLAALGRPGLDQLGAGKLHRRGRPCEAGDPVAFRIGLLDGTGRNAGSAPNSVGGAKRQAAVVQRAAQKAGLGRHLPKDTGLGIATTFGQERDMPTWVACVARVHVDRGSGAVTVEKLTIVVDAGTIVHPDGARRRSKAAPFGASAWRCTKARSS